MKLKGPAILGLAGVLLGLLGARGGNALGRKIEAERAAAARIQSRIGALRQRREADLADLAQAEKELRALQPLAARSVDQGRKSEIQAWLARVKRLKQLFAERADRRIPELGLLTDDDWLRVARWASLGGEADERKAMGAARNAAKRLMADLLGSALRAYANAHQNALPARAAELAPYLSDPRAAPALARYEMLAPSAVPSSKPSTANALSEIAPVDPDADSKIILSNNGGCIITLPPAAWIPGFDAARKNAYRAYSAANKGAPAPNAAEVIPYFDPPLDSLTQQKFLQSAQASLEEF
ncbi:MAG TPA: hypothetical protein VHC86_01940 [Opitutaceae bacterium]|nr:hypothetical protein [Opitutaceae bacterium]